MVGFTGSDFGAFDCLLLRERPPLRGKKRQRILHYRDPYGIGSFWKARSDEELDREMARFDPERWAKVRADSLTEYLARIDRMEDV